MQYPDRLTAPFDGDHLTGGNIGYVDFDRGAGGTCLVGRRERSHEGNGGSNARHAAYGTGGSYPETARWIGWKVGINRSGIIELCRSLAHSSILNSCPSRAYHSLFLTVYYLIRSEEHTSELQSLMRISYAVFCLKKNQTTL